MATRKASGLVLDALAPVLPELWGGSADLAGSNNTTMDGEPSFLPTDRQSKKFPGNPTRSYRSSEPLRVVGEVDDWSRLTPEALQQWRDRLAELAADERGEIIN